MSRKSNSSDNELATILEEIRVHLSDFKIDSVKLLGEGWMSKALLVNDEWVFRFPKKSDGADDLEKEIRILPHLSDHITLAIPQFEIVGKRRNGFPFVGYKILPGEVMEENAITSLPEDIRIRIAQQIAKFIDEISAFPIVKARTLNVPEINYREKFSKEFKEVQHHIFPLVDQGMQQYITVRFESYLGNPDLLQYQPTLIHADLSPDHYLYDPIEHKLTGIIDFGDITIGDPDYEYVYILEDCGEDFTRQVMEFRGQDEIEKRMDKIGYFVSFDHIVYVLEGVRRGNQDWINEGIEAIRSEMMFRYN